MDYKCAVSGFVYANSANIESWTLATRRGKELIAEWAFQKDYVHDLLSKNMVGIHYANERSQKLRHRSCCFSRSGYKNAVLRIFFH